MDPNHNERTVIERRDPLIGEVFDRRFRIEARIAAGGFGAIYRATHIKSGHKLALKILHANLTDDPGVVARFRREGAALTRLRDPHTITAYELGEAPDGKLYIVMELLHGTSLYERYRAHGPLPWQRVIAIARDVCSSLAEAHALGIIHRDLKPTNIHLEPHGPDDDFVKVLDFGIAKIVLNSDLDSTELTHAGQMIGTLDYMSPEQMVGGMCDATSDIYTLGVVMYEMIAGKKPFDDANSAAAALAAVLTTTPERLSILTVVPADVDRIVMRCIERNHTDRFQSAAALAAALDEILAAGEEAVTSVDLSYPRGAIATLKGMRVPAMPPATGPVALELVPAPVEVAPPATAPVAPAPAPPRLTPTGRAASPARLTPSGRATSPARLTPTGRAAPRLTPTPTPAPLSAGAALALIERTTEPMPPPAGQDAAATGTDGERIAAFATTISGPGAPPAAPRPPRPTPSLPRLDPVDPDATLIGPPVISRPPASRPPPSGTPQGGTLLPAKSLREAYPMIHRPVPSVTRPQTSPFDDRPPSGGMGAAFDMSQVVRHGAALRRLALAVGVAIVIALIFLAARYW